MSTDLTGKVAMISGAARGLGLAQALLMAERGADIVLIDVNGEALAEAAAEIMRLGRRAHAAVADVADIKATAEVVAAAERALGSVDILVNNAGISGFRAEFQKIDEATFDRMFDVHVKGAFFLTQHAVRGMKARRYGRIINISSNRGMVGFELSSHYTGAKSALLGLTKAWARELAPHNILVNCVAPGVVRTDMTSSTDKGDLRAEADANLLKRWAEPVEIAYTVAFLASREADFITGQVVCPNGGDPVI